MARKRVVSFVIDLGRNPVVVIAQGASGRGTRFGHTVVELPPHQEGQKPTLNGLSDVIALLLGHDPNP